jgi:L-alanine-DL-glutamate epimerase-like enolase superfamily enzyme
MFDSIRQFSRMDVISAEIYTDEGLTGWGFTYAISERGGDAIRLCIEKDIAPLIVGENPLNTERLWETMWRRMDWVGRGGIAILGVAAVDIAAWDLKAKAAKLPLHQLLGGYRDKVPVYNTDGGWLNHTIDQLVAEAKEVVARGFKGVKIKVGKPDPAEDVERVAAVREAIGPHVNFMVDANERWTAAEAIKRGAMFEEFNLFWFEEPLPAEDIGGHAWVKAHLNIPIALGESLYNKNQFKDYIQSNGVSIVQPDAGRVGGITEWRKVAAMADAWNMQVSPHFLMELHLPLVASIPNGLFVEYIPSLDPILEKPLDLKDGHFIPSTEPGLGIPIDPDKLAKYRVE